MQEKFAAQQQLCVLLLLILHGTGWIMDPSLSAAEPARRPNILFCFADDWGCYASAYTRVESRPSPNQVVKTPHIDSVARAGILFRNAFVGSPSCTPCRSALLSGQYFFRTGRAAILQGAIWDTNIPSFPHLLHDAGYHIGETYKVWSPGSPNDAPFGAGKYAYEKAGGRYNNFSENATAMVRAGKTFVEAKETLLAEVRGNFCDFLDARAQKQNLNNDSKEKERPWMYWFGPTLVHRAWERGSGKALWNIDPDSLRGKLPGHLPDVPETRADFADYLGEIQAWDAGVGVLLEVLRQRGEWDNTIVVISGDHGAPGFPRGKCNLYDFGTRVALLARMPGGKGGRVVDDFVHLMDLAPTFLEAGGVTPPAVMTGKSLLSVMRDERSGQIDAQRTGVITGRERHVAGARPGNLPYPHRALRTRDFLYIRNFHPDRWPMGSPPQKVPAEGADFVNNTFAAYADMDGSPTKAWLIAQEGNERWKTYYDWSFAKRPGEELYDLRDDPDQLKNVAENSAYAAAKRELAERLLAELTQASDPRVLGDGSTFDKPPYSDPVERVPPKTKRAKAKSKPK